LISKFMVAFICLMIFIFYKNKFNWNQTICKEPSTICLLGFLLVKFEGHNAPKSHHTCTNETSSAPCPHTQKYIPLHTPNQNIIVMFWRKPMS
jgi:hypothetical protein